VFPAGRFVVEESNTPQPQRVPNRLFVDTQPHGAQVWVEGVWKGNTPLDLLVGAGAKRLVLAAAGYHMFRTTVDAGEGTLIRLALEPVAGPVRGDAFLNVVCRTSGRYPVFIDEVETGLLCPPTWCRWRPEHTGWACSYRRSASWRRWRSRLLPAPSRSMFISRRDGLLENFGPVEA